MMERWLHGPYARIGSRAADGDGARGAGQGRGGGRGRVATRDEAARAVGEAPLVRRGGGRAPGGRAPGSGRRAAEIGRGRESPWHTEPKGEALERQEPPPRSTGDGVGADDALGRLLACVDVALVDAAGLAWLRDGATPAERAVVLALYERVGGGTSEDEIAAGTRRSVEAVRVALGRLRAQNAVVDLTPLSPAATPLQPRPPSVLFADAPGPAGVALAPAVAEALYLATTWVFLDNDGVEEDLRDERLWVGSGAATDLGIARWRYVLYGIADLGVRLARRYLPVPAPPATASPLFATPDAVAAYAGALRVERHVELLMDGLGRHEQLVDAGLRAPMETELGALLGAIQARLDEHKGGSVASSAAYLGAYGMRCAAPAWPTGGSDGLVDYSEGGVLARVLWHGLNHIERPTATTPTTSPSLARAGGPEDASTSPAPGTTSSPAPGTARAREVLQLLLYLPFHRARRGRWWIRLVRLLERLQPTYAFECAQQALRDPWVVGSARVALQMRLAAMSRLKPPITTRPFAVPELRPPRATVTITADRALAAPPTFKGPKSVWTSSVDGRAITVEEIVLEHFAREGGWSGLHCEVRVWRTLFSYLLLDELFGPVDDRGGLDDGDERAPFRHPFQDRPLDLMQVDAFYARRAMALESKLARLEAGDGVAVLRAAWARLHHGGRHACFGIEFQYNDLALLQAIVEACPGRGLACVLRLMARHYPGTGAGMPDLVLWRPAADGSPAVLAGHRFCLAEVKGPHDRVSDEQRFFIDQLEEAGLAVILCQVAAAATTTLASDPASASTPSSRRRSSGPKFS